MKVINPRLNIVFAICLVCVPIIMSLMDIFGMYLALPYYIVFWGVLYGAMLIVCVTKYLLKGGKFDFKKIKNPFIMISALMLLWIIISSVVNLSFNINLISYLTYFLIFICVFMLDKRWRKILLDLMLIVIAVSCLMGFIFMYTKAVPGLDNDHFYIALHFTNPNYASHIIAGLTLVCFVMFDSAENKRYATFYLIVYLIYATHLFVNGSFVAITTLIITEVLVQIFLSMKTKKFKFKMLILTTLLLPICLLVEILPNIETIRTCKYNYLLECVAVFDNVFNTNILDMFGIELIEGSDGWNRSELLRISWNRATSSPKAFIFGGGAGLFYEYRPHHGLLSLMLDFGFVVPLLFTAFIVVMLVKIIKTKMPIVKLKFLPAIICFLACYISGSIVPNSFYVFMFILALTFKDFKEES